LGSSLPPAEFVRRDSGVFEEIKHLFSIAPKDGKGGKVTGVFLTKKHLSNAGLGSVGRRRQCLMAYPSSCAVEKEASDVVVLKRQTLGVSIY
jgi:hypothetical protein